MGRNRPSGATCWLRPCKVAELGGTTAGITVALFSEVKCAEGTRVNTHTHTGLPHRHPPQGSGHRPPPQLSLTQRSTALTEEALSSSSWEHVLPVCALADSGAGIASAPLSRNRPPCHLGSAPGRRRAGLSVMETSSQLSFSDGAFLGKTAPLSRLTGVEEEPRRQRGAPGAPSFKEKGGGTR